MTWLSESNLVSAISNAGGLGVIAAGSMNNSQLEKEILKTRQKKKNLWCKSNSSSSRNRKIN